MATRKQIRIRLLIIGVVLLVISAIAIGYGFRNSIEFYKIPAQVINAETSLEKFRLGGMVKTDSTEYVDGGAHFIIYDNEAEIKVHYSGILPDLFAEEQVAIARGVMKDGVFIADEVLAKHDETYIPREVADELEKQGLSESMQKVVNDQ